MRSPNIESYGFIPAEEKLRYSDLQVLHSNAGYYIGTLHDYYENGVFMFTEPGSRDSHYFDTRTEAQAYLTTVEQESDPAIVKRMLRQEFD